MLPEGLPTSPLRIKRHPRHTPISSPPLPAREMPTEVVRQQERLILSAQEGPALGSPAPVSLPERPQPQPRCAGEAVVAARGLGPYGEVDWSAGEADRQDAPAHICPFMAWAAGRVERLGNAAVTAATATTTVVLVGARAVRTLVVATKRFVERQVLLRPARSVRDTIQLSAGAVVKVPRASTLAWYVRYSRLSNQMVFFCTGYMLVRTALWSLGFSPSFTLPEGVPTLIRWFLNMNASVWTFFPSVCVGVLGAAFGLRLLCEWQLRVLNAVAWSVLGATTGKYTSAGPGCVSVAIVKELRAQMLLHGHAIIQIAPSDLAVQGIVDHASRVLCELQTLARSTATWIHPKFDCTRFERATFAHMRACDMSAIAVAVAELAQVPSETEAFFKALRFTGIARSMAEHVVHLARGAGNA